MPLISYTKRMNNQMPNFIPLENIVEDLIFDKWLRSNKVPSLQSRTQLVALSKSFIDLFTEFRVPNAHEQVSEAFMTWQKNLTGELYADLCLLEQDLVRRMKGL